MAYVDKMVAQANARLRGRGVMDREWYVNTAGNMRLRDRIEKQCKMDLGEAP